MTKVVLCSPLQKIEGNKIRAKYVCFCGMCEFTFGATFMYCTRKNNNNVILKNTVTLILFIFNAFVEHQQTDESNQKNKQSEQTVYL